MEREVLGEAEVEDEPAPLAVLGDVTEPLVDVVARVAPREVLAAHDHTAGLDLAQPGERVDQLRLAVAVDAGDADDLPGAHLEGDVAHGREPPLVEDGEVLDREDRRAGARRLLLDPEQDLAADHYPGQARFGRSLARHGVDQLAASERS